MIIPPALTDTDEADPLENVSDPIAPPPRILSSPPTLARISPALPVPPNAELKIPVLNPAGVFLPSTVSDAASISIGPVDPDDKVAAETTPPFSTRLSSTARTETGPILPSPA